MNLRRNRQSVMPDRSRERFWCQGVIRWVFKDGTEVYRDELQPVHDYESGLLVREDR